MLHALSFALMDSVNVLLIGVIVAIGVVLGPRAKYPQVAALLVGGDWLGVFVASIPTLLLFNLVESKVKNILDSPVFGILLIATGVLGAVLTMRGGDSSGLIQKILDPLRAPSVKTVLTGFVLGVVQSFTSVPFFGGLAYLSASGFSSLIKYTTLVLYATLALSLPALTAVLVGFVRKYPESPAGRGFEWAREHQTQVSAFAGYFVAVVLILMGVFHL
ncbi:hypothetical protein WG936_07940 [Corynebacterium sp. H127]|uniref:hypothetical protein n=1 Tax=Corynebacterium sp. H127 TaxID=3133418 RepID=UPI0030A129E6